MQKCPESKNSGHLLSLWYIAHTFFSHPDFTVGTGIPPVQPFSWVADCNRR